MATFLENIFYQLAQDTKNLADKTFVFPNKRAGGFFKNLLKTSLDYSGFAPKVMSIEELITEITQLKIIDNTHSIFRFYEVYTQNTPKEALEDFETFYGWAQTLIYDFNEVDRYLIQPKKFFNYLADIQNIEHWSVAQPQTELVKNYLAFWNKLPAYHQQLVQLLIHRKEGYQGLLYRKASEQIDAYLNRTSESLFFIGFNALNNAEQKIIQTVLAQKRGAVFWDIDQQFLEDEQHEAGLFMRQYRKKWSYYANQKNSFKEISSDYVQDKKIEIIGIPKNIGQANYVGQIIANNNLKNTAVVLNDEGLLIPVLNALPQSVKELNITMGFSLEWAPLASLFEILFRIQENNQQLLYYKNVLEILGHPAIKRVLLKEGQQILTSIAEQNLVFLTPQDLTPSSASKKTKKILSLCFTNYKGDIFRLLTAFISLTETIRPQHEEQAYALESEYLFHFNRVFKKLQNLLTRHNPITTVKTLHRLYNDLLRTEQLHFEGSPYDGLQIMGMLETRALDYETVILTSVNEGVLPSGKSTHSFIPYDLKKQYGLPTYKEKDAVYTYHFYRLLQRAKKVYLLYNTDRSGLNAGEKSRFITQLLIESPKNIQLSEKLITPQTPAIKNELQKIEKTPEVLQKIKEQAEKGFSPSALNTYIRNPIDFYKKYVLGINDNEEEVEETIAANTLGSVVHNTLEKLYKPLEGKVVHPKDCEDMLQKYETLIAEEFKHLYSQAPINKGTNLIIFEVAKRYVYNFIQKEKKLTAKNSLKILHVETASFTQPLTIPELPFPVFLRGKVDRIDEENGCIRIIDYKTGAVKPSDLKLSSWEELIKNERYGKAFQLLCYSSVLLHNKNYQTLTAGIISFKNLKKGVMPFSVNKVTEIDADTIKAFHHWLSQLILEIFNPEIPFIEKELPNND